MKRISLSEKTANFMEAMAEQHNLLEYYKLQLQEVEVILRSLPDISNNITLMILRIDLTGRQKALEKCIRDLESNINPKSI